VMRPDEGEGIPIEEGEKVNTFWAGNSKQEKIIRQCLRGYPWKQRLKKGCEEALFISAFRDKVGMENEDMSSKIWNSLPKKAALGPIDRKRERPVKDIGIVWVKI